MQDAETVLEVLRERGRMGLNAMGFRCLTGCG